ncbi:HAD family phosphatase [Exilibacterium tricleocarpae]|uniref:HAD family phosphatase n=1 Tax=Exilibacterium tricleocarpae TaxID=2591008 RepID=A0A545TFQ6_9GAMM|nr:HAD family phosphatase [Exilibacterium tricleocarpae]TQV76059.1 HAD family phosphatase [Exilibacterium tricleocarpae]
MKNIIFDLGAVLLQWDPQKIVGDFTADTTEQALLLAEAFGHSDWQDMDRGMLSEVDFIARLSQRCPVFSSTRLEHLLQQVRDSLLPIARTEALLHRAHAGSKRLYCLSNMSVENYAYLKDKLAFFERFDGIVISGHEQMAKPDSAIFTLLLERFSLSPRETVFIDDLAANVEAARDLGIRSIQFEQTDTCYADIEALLTTHT